MNILITIDEQVKNFILTPVDFEIKSLGGVSMYVKNINNGRVVDGSVIISYSDTDVNQIYADIIGLFERRWGCQFSFTESANRVLRDAEEERGKFILFSEKALKIRNNEIDRMELEELIGVLNKRIFIRTLKPFQLLSAHHLAYSQNACNFSVPGSGKTSTVLAAYHLLKNISNSHKRVEKLLVVGPLSSFFAWKEEYKECFGHYPKCIEIFGGISQEWLEGKLLRSNIDEEVVLINYESLSGKRDIIQKFLYSNKVMVVLDEAHRIKNTEDGVWSTAALSIARFAKSRVVLTGTPAANSYLDLYNLFKFIWPAQNVIGYSTAQLASIGQKPNDLRVKDLTSRIAPFYIRIKKSDLELPPPVYNEPEVVKMSPTQRKIYDSIFEITAKSFAQTDTRSFFKKAAFIRLRQAASNPRLLAKPLDDYIVDEFGITEFEDNNIFDDDLIKLIRDYDETPGKFLSAKDLAEKTIKSGNKIIIWCEFIGTCNDLSDYFLESGIKNRILYGNTPHFERGEIISEFHNNPDLSVLIANPHAVGESISLHRVCHNALYLEQGYNAGVYMQSKDRIHRVGLAEDVKTNYFYFHSEDSIDSLSYNRVMYKENRMLELIESEEIPLIYDNKDFMEDMEDDIKALMREYYARK